MFRVMFGILLVIVIAGLFYLLTRFHKFPVFKKIAKEKIWLSWLLAFLPVAALILWCVTSPYVGLIASFHLLIFWLFSDLLGVLIRKITKSKKQVYWQGLLAFAITIIYLGAGWYFAHHVQETDYRIITDKELGMDSLRIVQISDSHVGTTFDGDGFARHMETIQGVHPDIVVITGDFVDDDSIREDMVKSCEALGKLQTTYGVYFVYGNHDKGYFQYRDFSAEDLAAELLKNHVTILEDEATLIADQIYLIGRKDRSFYGRQSMEELILELDTSKYILVLDHQPHDYDAQTKAKVDLVLSGHTHGGQMIPIGLIGEWMGANDKTYGLEVRDQTTFIVNSGISDWAIPFKTGTVSEFGVIDITSK